MRYKIGYYEKVFIFVFLIAMALFLIFRATERPFILLKEKKFKIIATKGYGLKSGSRVLMKDLEIGVVQDVYLNDENFVEIIFSIKRKYQDRIRKDSIAKISIVPILGSSEIIITPGSKNTEELKNGDIITLQEETSDVLAEISSLPKKIEPAIKNLNETLKNFNIISSDIVQGRGSIGKFLADEEIYDNTLTLVQELNKFVTGVQPATQNLIKASEMLPHIAKNIDKLIQDVEKMQKDFEGITANLKDTTATIASITKKIDKGEGTIGKILTNDSLHTQAVKTLSSTGNILNKIESVNISSGMDTSFQGPELVVSKIYSKISSNKTGGIKLGGTFVGYKKENIVTRPDILYSHKLFPGNITLEAGVLEGQIGGSIKYPVNEKTNFLVEARRTSKNYIYDNNIEDFLLRSYFGVRINNYLQFKLGATDILNKPTLSGGIIIDKDNSK